MCGLDEEAAWIEGHRQLWAARFDELDMVVEELKRKGKQMDASREDGSTGQRYASSMSEGSSELDIDFLHELLQPICSEPLTGVWRAVGQVFEFGVQRPMKDRKGEGITRGDFDLKFIYADWRVVHHGRVILGSTDHCDDEQFYNSDQPPELPYNAEARRLACDFFDALSEAKFIVESVVVRDHADVAIRLSDELLIESFSSSGQDSDSWWFSNRRTDVSCLVGPSGHNVGESKWK